MPSNNEDYFTWCEKIYSPIAGQVVKVMNDISDNRPFYGKYPYNTSNTVVIQNKNYYLLMGHFKEGSIQGSEEDTVKKSQIIAEAGNSGMSERPHLHMQLISSDSGNYWSGRRVSMQEKGRDLSKYGRVAA